MVMVSNQTSADVGYLAAIYPGRIGHLYSPGGQRGPWHYLPYALDNGAFPAFSKGAEWNEGEWRSLLRWAAMSGQRPLWVLVPDVVGNREATIAGWHRYADEVRGHGFAAAFAVQDGMTFEDAPPDCALFLGGSTDWKEDAIVPWCTRFPGRIHVGRVNGWPRLIKCWRAGAVSVDGTGWFHRGRSAATNQRADLEKFLRETTARSEAA